MKWLNTVATVALASLMSSAAEAHMWLRVPLSRGGLNNIGGTGGSCNGLAAGSGNRAAFEVGQNVTFQFRVNQHGPGPFRFAFAESNDAFNEILVNNIENQVTAGPDGFQGVNVVVTIPNVPCTQCSIQLSGMAKNDGTQRWYNCADISIGAKGSLGLSFPSAVSPSSAPTTGGTTVTITGTGFGSSSSSNLKCAFDDIVVNANWISDTQISCNVPPRNAPSTAALEVSINNGDSFSNTGTVFTYNGGIILPEIANIEPTIVSSGQTVTITGRNIYSESVMCKFIDTYEDDSTAVPATAVTNNKITCVVPEGLSGAVGVEISVDNSPYSQSGRNLSVNGATALTFSGYGLILSLVLAITMMAF